MATAPDSQSSPSLTQGRLPVTFSLPPSSQGKPSVSKLAVSAPLLPPSLPGASPRSQIAGEGTEKREPDRSNEGRRKERDSMEDKREEGRPWAEGGTAEAEARESTRLEGARGRVPAGLLQGPVPSVCKWPWCSHRGTSALLQQDPAHQPSSQPSGFIPSGLAPRLPEGPPGESQCPGREGVVRGVGAE